MEEALASIYAVRPRDRLARTEFASAGQLVDGSGIHGGRIVNPYFIVRTGGRRALVTFANEVKSNMRGRTIWGSLRRTVQLCAM